MYSQTLDIIEYQITSLDMQVWSVNTAESTPYSKSTLLLCSTVVYIELVKKIPTLMSLTD